MYELDRDLLTTKFSVLTIIVYIVQNNAYLPACKLFCLCLLCTLFSAHVAVYTCYSGFTAVQKIRLAHA